MRIVFMGTPDFAVPVLSALVDAGHDLVAVYTQPDRPLGRGRRTRPTPVKAYALERGLDVFQPESLRKDDLARRRLSDLALDVIVVAAYGLYLPADVLEAPRLGCLNVHPSLLPKYRGPSPVAAAILAGDEVTGATVMEVTERVDSGPVVARRRLRIRAGETAGELTGRLFRLGACLMVAVLPQWAAGEIEASPQDDTQATMTRLLTREDGAIDWTAPAERIARQVRAYDPWPGSFTRWDGRRLKILEATASRADPGGVATGTVVAGLDGVPGVVTGEGVLRLGKLQMEGRRALDAPAFARGQAGFVGARLG